MDDIKELYDEMREEYLEGLADRRYVTLEEARRNPFVIDWQDPSMAPEKVRTPYLA